VPALASPLWLAYVPPALVRATVRQGREGSQMEGFASDDAEPILQGAEVDAVLDVVLTGGLAAEADPATRARVAAGSCEACHPRRGDYVDGRDESARAAFLSDHPWRWSLADWLTDEGLALGDCAEEVEREDGSRARVHGGERLYGALCVGCHEDPERAPPGQEPAAPALRGVLRREHFDVGYLLAGLILGRADAAPVKWRHQGITRAEYTAEQLACVARWLEETP
jgi:mono/diheme cytochrome c family protein